MERKITIEEHTLYQEDYQNTDAEGEFAGWDSEGWRKRNERQQLL